MIQTITKQDIIQKIEKDLKDKKYADLSSKYRGISVEPIYTKEETKPLELITLKESNEWEIAQRYVLANPASDNRNILHDLNNGVQTLVLDFSNCGSWTTSDLTLLFQKIELKYISLHIRNLPQSLMATAVKFFEGEPAPLHGSCGEVQIKGFMHPVIQIGTETKLSEALVHLHQAIENGKNPQVDWKIGDHFFGEIASLRAYRYLWERVLLYYKKDFKISILGSVQASETTADKNSNMIRNTIKAMSAAVGGVNALFVESHDLSNPESAQNGVRLARNIQLILQEESGLHLVSDPAHGSYFIENLSNQVAEQTWKEFVQVGNASN